MHNFELRTLNFELFVRPISALICVLFYSLFFPFLMLE